MALPATADAIVTMTPAIAEPRAVTDAHLNMPAHHGKSDTEKTPNPAKDVFKSYMEAGAPPVDSYTYLSGATAQKRKVAGDTVRFFVLRPRSG